MKNNETGEFELVLGNRQLLSGFFIVVLLFGVAFAMGYIVGRNSTPSQRLQAEATTGSAVPVPKERPEPASAPASAAAPPASAQPPADSTPAPQSTAGTPASPAATPPAQSTTPPAQPATQPAPPPTPPAPSAESPAEAPPGSYWQVIATSNRTAAEALQQSLKDKGFPVTLGPGPNNLVRVLVGPYSDTQSMGRAKTLLEAAGLHPVRK
jgi:cell division septation protein DedD